MSGKLRPHEESYDKYTILDGEKVSISASEVRAQHNHVMFIDPSGDVVGAGYRA